MRQEIQTQRLPAETLALGVSSGEEVRMSGVPQEVQTETSFKKSYEGENRMFRCRLQISVLKYYLVCFVFDICFGRVLIDFVIFKYSCD